MARKYSRVVAGLQVDSARIPMLVRVSTLEDTMMRLAGESTAESNIAVASEILICIIPGETKRPHTYSSPQDPSLHN